MLTLYFEPFTCLNIFGSCWRARAPSTRHPRCLWEQRSSPSPPVAEETSSLGRLRERRVFAHRLQQGPRCLPHGSFPSARALRPLPPPTSTQSPTSASPAFVWLLLAIATRKSGGSTRTLLSTAPLPVWSAPPDSWLAAAKASHVSRCLYPRAGANRDVFLAGGVSSPCCRLVFNSRDLRAQQHDVCLGELHQPYPRVGAAIAQAAAGGRGSRGRGPRWGPAHGPGAFPCTSQTPVSLEVSRK